jgi:3',5'-cyclic AMP phosphodiesterase CpdA
MSVEPNRRPTTPCLRVVALTLLLAAVLAGCGDAPAARSGAGGSTLDATWRDPTGSGELVRGAGEAPVDRTDLGPRVDAGAGSELARFGLLTDAHVRDEESPARAAFLDRLGPPFTPTFRPQEALTTQVLAGALRALRSQRPRQIVEAGDLIDNAQADELDEALAVLRGGPVDPDSGAPGYTGLQEPDNPDPFYYRPDVDPPVHPGLLDTAQRAFRSPGAGVPWLPVLGNHDWLVAGEVRPTARLDAVATGDRAVVDVDAEAAVDELGTRTPSAEAIDRLIGGGLPGREIAVPADPERRLLSRQEVVDRLRAASGVGGSGPDLDYVEDLGPRVRLIVLDTEAGDGTLTPAQSTWMRAQLEASGERWVLLATHRPLRDAVLSQLAAFPRVVAVLNGHTHRSSIEPYRLAGTRGFWLIGTASLADWPQQARMLSLRETAGGGVVLTTWMVDPDGSGLVGTARELAYLDAQGGRPAGDAGAPRDRNARLFRGPP